MNGKLAKRIRNAVKSMNMTINGGAPAGYDGNRQARATGFKRVVTRLKHDHENEPGLLLAIEQENGIG